MKVLVIAEHDNQQIKTSTLNTITAALNLSADITVLIAGYQCLSVAQMASKVCGIAQVILVDASCYKQPLAENLSQLIVKLAQGYEYILAPASTFGKNILPRVAALLDVAQISEVIQIVSPDTFVRPIYAGNALLTVQTKDAIKVMTIRTTAFPVAMLNERQAVITPCDVVVNSVQSQFVRYEMNQSTRPELSNARIIVSGGRGLQSKENFKLLEELADCLNAAIGASRAAVDAGFVSNDYQIGQTGKVVAPELYIAVGISGAIQHIAGMKDSRIIVAINKDPDAPIFQLADYSLVGDLFELVPILSSELKKNKAEV